MPLATVNGDLTPIEKCVLSIPDVGEIVMDNLPEISDTKNAVYNNQEIIGRSFPLYTYHYSGDRSISMTMHFFIRKQGDATKNIDSLRMIESAVYPRIGTNSMPFIPPRICTIECGHLLGDGPLCVILQSYSVKFPTNVAWDEETYCPYQFDVTTQWLAVYTSCKLPNEDQIVRSGR